MAKKRIVKKARKAGIKDNTNAGKILLWRWIIILIPLIVAIIWVITLLSAYDEIPIVYEQASPQGVQTLIGLILAFIISYGSFVFIEFRSKMQEL